MASHWDISILRGSDFYFDSKMLMLSLGLRDLFLGSCFPPYLALHFDDPTFPFYSSRKESHTLSPRDTCFASQGHEKYFKNCLSFSACGGGKCRTERRQTALEKLDRGPEALSRL